MYRAILIRLSLPYTFTVNEFRFNSIVVNCVLCENYVFNQKKNEQTNAIRVTFSLNAWPKESEYDDNSEREDQWTFIRRYSENIIKLYGS